MFASKVAGTKQVNDASVVVIDEDGARIEVEISSVPLLKGDRVVGVFGQIPHWTETTELAPHPHLTPRQAEVLHLLEHGRSTAQIAAELHLSQETVRNHVHAVLGKLQAADRAEVIVRGRDAGLGR